MEAGNQQIDRVIQAIKEDFFNLSFKSRQEHLANETFKRGIYVKWIRWLKEQLNFLIEPIDMDSLMVMMVRPTLSMKQD